MASPRGGIPRKWSATAASSRRTSLEIVLVVLPARSNASQARLSPSTRSFQCLKSIVLLSSDVERLLDIGDGDALRVHDVDAELRLVLLAVRREAARLGHLRLRQLEPRRHRPAGGL